MMAPIMVLAMMLPAAIPAVDHVRRNSLRPRRGRAVVEFLAAYTVVWTLFMVAATLALGTIRDRLPASWPGDPILAALFAVAAVWQISRHRRRLLQGCRRARPLAVHGWGATRDATAFGLTYGLRCLATCWALMLVTLGHGLVGLVTMALLALYIWCERTQPLRGRSLARPSAALLSAVAVAYLLI
jgi:predicted metal-binding membrane protein